MTAFESPPPTFARPAARTRHDSTTGDRAGIGAQVGLRRTDVDCGAGSTAMLVALTGEIDASNSAWLAVQLSAVITSASTVHTGTAPSGGVVIDLTRVRFCDASGITALVRAFKHARDQRFPLELAGASGRVDRILRLTGIDDVLTLHPQPEDALKALNSRT